MCTCISYQSKKHYFGRNLDLEYSLNESVIITPRKYPISFRECDCQNSHYAMIGVGLIADNYPLYYDATNEYGLSIAGLNFPGNAVYQSHKDNKYNVTPYELIPWLLGQCRCVSEAKRLLEQTNILNKPFSKEYALTPLHWMIADRNNSIVVEPIDDGVVIYDNPAGVLTNNPTFEYHLQNLSNYLNLCNEDSSNPAWNELEVKPTSKGWGAFGLPGDLSSPSRFVRAVFTKLHAVDDGNDNSAISQFFHILNSVSQTKGTVVTEDGLERTVYTSCCDTEQGIYYYTTYDNSQISAVDLHNEALDCDSLRQYPFVKGQQINRIN